MISLPGQYAGGPGACCCPEACCPDPPETLHITWTGLDAITGLPNTMALQTSISLPNEGWISTDFSTNPYGLTLYCSIDELGRGTWLIDFYNSNIPLWNASGHPDTAS